MEALKKQIGGDHYKKFKIQPIEFILANNLGFAEGCIIKYICRYKFKGGKEDLEKIKHYVDILIENFNQGKEHTVDDYLKGHNNCGLKVGDRVRLIRKAETHEKGWNNGWASEMDKYVNCIGVIVEDNKQLGFAVEFKYPNGNSPLYNYPYFVLEKVEGEKYNE